MVVLTAQLMQKLGNYQMTIIDLPMNIVYGVVPVRLRDDDGALGLADAPCTGGAATACSSDPTARPRTAEPC